MVGKMRLKTPEFWTKKSHWLSRVLMPLGHMYAFFDRLRRRRITPARVSVPVICVGNATVGGTGKTPVTIYLAQTILEMKHRCHILSRGYGGISQGVTQVDVERHTAQDVGDEPLLLARVAPTWVGPDRVALAQAAIEAGAQILLLDDGLQNPSLHKDCNILVVDAGVGFGNDNIFPAGPLRESVKDAVARSEAVVLVGQDKFLPLHFDKPTFKAHLVFSEETLEHFRGRKIVAFCGLGNPQKFHKTLRQLEISLCAFETFPDHYNYTSDDMARLRDLAHKHEALLATTEKDWVRLSESDRERVSFIPISLDVTQVGAFRHFLIQQLRGLAHEIKDHQTPTL